MIELQGRRALVTGAAQGLGLAIARLFAQRGAQLPVEFTSGLIPHHLRKSAIDSGALFSRRLKEPLPLLFSLHEQGDERLPLRLGPPLFPEQSCVRMPRRLGGRFADRSVDGTLRATRPPPASSRAR